MLVYKKDKHAQDSESIAPVSIITGSVTLFLSEKRSLCPAEKLSVPVKWQGEKLLCYAIAHEGVNTIKPCALPILITRTVLYLKRSQHKTPDNTASPQTFFWPGRKIKGKKLRAFSDSSSLKDVKRAECTAREYSPLAMAGINPKRVRVCDHNPLLPTDEAAATSIPSLKSPSAIQPRHTKQTQCNKTHDVVHKEVGASSSVKSVNADITKLTLGQVVCSGCSRSVRFALGGGEVSIIRTCRECRITHWAKRTSQYT